ncbi:MAG TPA: hypothetical protein VN380_00935 [Thermoanaerobaculia bacterium]|jgi:hypothetical protein|nr:hypothetical protein [Thermoanaerobaculia bacterium]
MNYDLAMMALDGLMRTPLTVRADGTSVTFTGEPAAFKELARLCLLLGGASDTDDAFELQPKVHVTEGSLGVKLVLVT